MPKLDEQDQRIADILGTKEVPDVTEETSKIYLDYITLQRHLSMKIEYQPVRADLNPEFFAIFEG